MGWRVGRTQDPRTRTHKAKAWQKSADRQYRRDETLGELVLDREPEAKRGLVAGYPVTKRLWFMNERREPRFIIEIGAAVEVNNSGRPVRATTINVSGSGVLLEFEELVQFPVGDAVFCDFNIAGQAENPLPCWGWGKVVRAEGRRIAVEFKAGCYEAVVAEGDGASRPA